MNNAVFKKKTGSKKEKKEREKERKEKEEREKKNEEEKQILRFEMEEFHKTLLKLRSNDDDNMKGMESLIKQIEEKIKVINFYKKSSPLSEEIILNRISLLDEMISLTKDEIKNIEIK